MFFTIGKRDTCGIGMKIINRFIVISQCLNTIRFHTSVYTLTSRLRSERPTYNISNNIFVFVCVQTDDKEDTHSDDDEERQHRPLYRQQPVPSRRSRLAHPVRPLSKRLGLPPTPPPPRRLAPVLSVDSLVAALHQADISYLDTGDLCRHSDELRAGSVPDLKKVFYTGFL